MSQAIAEMSLDLNCPPVGVKPVLEPVFSSAMRDSTKRLFHSGVEPSKLDQDDLEALVYANIKPSLHLTIHRWKKYILCYLPSDKISQVLH